MVNAFERLKNHSNSLKNINVVYVHVLFEKKTGRSLRNYIFH